MLLLGIALCYLLGYSVLLTISKKFTLPESIGFSFLIGIGLETVFLFLLDILQMHYSPPLLIGINLVLIVALTYKYSISAQTFKEKLDELKASASSPNYVAIVSVLHYSLPVLCNYGKEPFLAPVRRR